VPVQAAAARLRVQEARVRDAVLRRDWPQDWMRPRSQQQAEQAARDAQRRLPADLEAVVAPFPHLLPPSGRKGAEIFWSRGIR
jgi:hypothetical protein